MNTKSPTVLGLDIGGANLKAATAAQRAVSVAFALWKQPDALPAALASLVAQFPEIDEFAVTMTGELCDCYATKREGVNRILDAVEFAASGRPVRVWGTGGSWLSVVEARVRTPEVAASNWHALATFAGRFAPEGNGLLIDMGSTTTDVIPLNDGIPASKGRTDFERLRTGELVYVGMRRTPIMALGIPQICSEYFADMRDALLALGSIPDDSSATDTADGRPATRLHSLARLARMLGADVETLHEKKICNFAYDCIGHQQKLLANGLLKVEPSRLRKLILSGEGEWLSRLAFEQIYPDTLPPTISLTEQLGPEISACAPAYAVAVLASEMPA